ncbi:hypothetical protein Tco_1350120, partial [Tanacetum coccineum]
WITAFRMSYNTLLSEPDIPDLEEFRNQSIHLCYHIAKPHDTLDKVNNCPQLVKLYNTPDPREFPTELLELQGQSHIFQFHYNPYCEKGRVDFYFDTILDRHLEIAGSSKTQTATTGSEPISPALETTETVSEEIVNNLPTQIAETPSQLIIGNPEVDMMTSNPSSEP